MALDQREPSDKILEQFGRQILVPGVDEDGQLQLTQRKICIIGIGALGTIASQYLVRSGIGDIHLIDPDVIEESNLHRQINYTLDDVGKYKSEVSKKILTNINDITSLKSYPVSFEKYLEKESIDHFDLVMDCTDSHQNKIFSSKYCKKKFIPFVSISINSSDGIYFSQNYKYNNKTSSCFECLFPQTEQNHRCLNSAMIGPVAGFVTSLACTRIIFALANQNLKLKNEINLIDLLTSDINKLQLKKISCPH